MQRTIQRQICFVFCSYSVPHSYFGKLHYVILERSELCDETLLCRSPQYISNLISIIKQSAYHSRSNDVILREFPPGKM